MANSRRLQTLLDMEPKARREALARMSEEERKEFIWHWELWARTEQLAPQGDWRTWLIMAGRGFGKTRAGAEWVRAVAEAEPAARIALVAASLPEARAVMVEGESGLLAVCPPRRRPHYEPSLRRVTWPNGAQALLFSAGEPESLRGPQHSHAWCDEIAKWDNAGSRALSAWDNLLLGLRLGEHPRLVATTTPRAVPLLRRLLAGPGDELAVTHGRTEENLGNLPDRYLRDVRRSFGRSLLGRQELDGELIEDLPGALWTRAMLEDCRETARSEPVRVVVGVDPPASSGGDACGIVVVAQGGDGIARVLADASLLKPSPERWARKVAAASEAWQADRVVAEANQGGEMVRSVLNASGIVLPVKLVHASRAKTARAEPVAALYEAGRVRHAGVFPLLEDELCGLIAGGGYEGPGRSPDRADALVWALSELMLERRPEPRVRMA
ncbi:phage terminase large subunit-like protein [Novosphingobium chloroacetimidivorans]|uniref:Phage terminase large subunit-like protein n=1 Tax=Novosphingobium chloroacetimidivorans TaxID=1428314 RepID=A0A7W7KC22_9SPHN|nr:terminase family protein [Novosphingobium chloroacetimidivorans]MBB4860057.1 phage terminase large subunit-like protein [Novosphingobium chloroacetimidivorans]